MRKNYVKLFEDFIKEEDPLADILGDKDKKDGDAKDGEEKDKEEEKPDPIKKMQDDEKKKAAKQEDNFDTYIDNKVSELKKVLDKYPDVKEELGKQIIDAVESKDRVKIHVAFNELMYLGMKYEKAGETDKVAHVSVVKDIVDKLDKSFTNNKMM